MNRFGLLLAEKRPLVMGILNVTPDSFSDGGKFSDVNSAVEHALQMISEGADVIDIGGESTRPGAEPVSTSEEMARVMPVLERLRAETDCCISIDTSTPDIITATAGLADLINDVRALTRDGALTAAAAAGVPVCLMHMQGQPKSMQVNPSYTDLLRTLKDFFNARITACVSHGISRDQLVLDPGFGFGKTPEQNLMLVNRLGELLAFDLPLLVGLSRKSTIGRLAGDEIVIGSVMGAMVAISKGASIVRVHDVRQTCAALDVVRAIGSEQMVANKW